MATTLEELEARVAALEAQQADYRAVLTTVNALAVQTRAQFDRMGTRIDQVEQKLDQKLDRQEAMTRFNTVDEHLAELKDLIIGLRDH
jgi:uncharacterized coiled-coil protein SlyX